MKQTLPEGLIIQTESEDEMTSVRRHSLELMKDFTLSQHQLPNAFFLKCSTSLSVIGPICSQLVHQGHLLIQVQHYRSYYGTQFFHVSYFSCHLFVSGTVLSFLSQKHSLHTSLDQPVTAHQLALLLYQKQLLFSMYLCQSHAMLNQKDIAWPSLNDWSKCCPYKSKKNGWKISNVISSSVVASQNCTGHIHILLQQPCEYYYAPLQQCLQFRCGKDNNLSKYSHHKDSTTDYVQTQQCQGTAKCFSGTFFLKPFKVKC